jgi:hypothetical protein
MQSLKDSKDTNQLQLHTSPAPGLASVICLLCLLSVWVLLTKVYGAIDTMNPCTPLRPPCAITANLFRHVYTWNRDVPAGVSLHLLPRNNSYVFNTPSDMFREFYWLRKEYFRDVHGRSKTKWRVFVFLCICVILSKYFYTVLYC